MHHHQLKCPNNNSLCAADSLSTRTDVSQFVSQYGAAWATPGATRFIFSLVQGVGRRHHQHHQAIQTASESLEGESYDAFCKSVSTSPTLNKFPLYSAEKFSSKILTVSSISGKKLYCLSLFLCEFPFWILNFDGLLNLEAGGVGWKEA